MKSEEKSEVILSISLPWAESNPDDLLKVTNNYLKLMLEKRKKKPKQLITA